MIRCMLVDDNKMARMALRQLISQVNELELISECESAMEAYNALQSSNIDLLFLDIEMPGISGLELARQLKDKKTLIIFTTGKSEYALDAFELNVVDYIMKPIVMTRFLQSIEKVKSLLKSENESIMQTDTQSFFVKDKGVSRRILLDDILYLEAMGDYVKVHLKDKNYMVHSTLKLIEQKLNNGGFLRVHRSYIIAINKIESIEDGVVHIQKHSVPVADAYRSALHQHIQFL